MGIQPVNSASPAPANQPDTQVSAIDAKIRQLQKAIQATKKDKMLDQEAKDRKIREYQEEIKRLQEEKARLASRSGGQAQAAPQPDAKAAEQSQAAPPRILDETV